LGQSLAKLPRMASKLWSSQITGIAGMSHYALCVLFILSFSPFLTKESLSSNSENHNLCTISTSFSSCHGDTCEGQLMEMVQTCSVN
jgi:hypothetical protein